MTAETPPDNYGTTPYEEPRSVRLTKTLIWPLLILHVLSVVLSLIAVQSLGPEEYLRENLRASEFGQLTPDMLDATFTVSLVAFVGFALVNVALFVVVGLGLRANRHWARFLGLVLAILFLISALYSLLFATLYTELSGLMLVEMLISWLIVILTIWWIMQALDKNTGEWFAMHRELQR